MASIAKQASLSMPVGLPSLILAFTREHVARTLYIDSNRGGPKLRPVSYTCHTSPGNSPGALASSVITPAKHDQGVADVSSSTTPSECSAISEVRPTSFNTARSVLT